MKKSNLVFLLFSFLACNNQLIQEKSSTTVVDSPGKYAPVVKPVESTTESNNYSGVLLVYPDSLHLDNQNFNIYNLDNSVFATVKSKNGNEPSSDKLKGKILAYYPDYYIVHFSAEKLSDGVYKVKVGSGSKVIKSTKYVEFLSLPEYVLKFFVTSTGTNFLRSSPSETATEVKGLDYKQLSFKCLEVKGDWVKVVCNAECEGCPEGQTGITGWVQWQRPERLS